MTIKVRTPCSIYRDDLAHSLVLVTDYNQIGKDEVGRQFRVEAYHVLGQRVIFDPVYT